MFLSNRTSWGNQGYDKYDLFAKVLWQWMSSFEHC